jgi:hypothetical protein
MLLRLLGAGALAALISTAPVEAQSGSSGGKGIGGTADPANRILEIEQRSADREYVFASQPLEPHYADDSEI